MLFIRVRDILPNLGIQLLALGIAIGAHSPSGITNALSAFKTLYENSIKLKSPEDDDAMLVYEALLRHAVTIISGDDTSSTTAFKKPNAADLERFGGPSPKEAVKALLKLREVKLVDIQAWGNDIGDINHPDNRWELRA
jgi:hypothetical protein